MTHHRVFNVICLFIFFITFILFAISKNAVLVIFCFFGIIISFYFLTKDQEKDYAILGLEEQNSVRK